MISLKCLLLLNEVKIQIKIYNRKQTNRNGYIHEEKKKEERESRIKQSMIVE